MVCRQGCQNPSAPELQEATSPQVALTLLFPSFSSFPFLSSRPILSSPSLFHTAVPCPENSAGQWSKRPYMKAASRLASLLICSYRGLGWSTARVLWTQAASSVELRALRLLSEAVAPDQRRHRHHHPVWWFPAWYRATWTFPPSPPEIRYNTVYLITDYNLMLQKLTIK